MSEKSKQHVQVPNSLSGKLDPMDVLVYTYLKSYMNKDSLECFPSLAELSKKSDIAINTIRKSIKVLQENKDISITKVGRKNVYKFNPKSERFEMFSFEFLHKDNLTPKDKAYLIVSQPHMYKEGKFGTISYSDDELGEKIGLTARAVHNRNKDLQSKNILTIQRSNLKDEETGLFLEIKQFDLELIGQAILFLGKKVNEHDNKLDDHTKQLEEQDKQIKELKEMIIKLQNEKSN